MPSQSEIYQNITHRILDALMFGTVPWRKPWRNQPNCGAPANVVSKRRYSGINPLLLDLVAMSRGFDSRWWGTFQQWEALGAHVKKRPADVKPGQWGTNIVFWKQITKKTVEDDEEKKSSFPMLRFYTLFNIDQVEGSSVDHLRAEADADSTPASIDFDPAQAVIEATQAKITYGGNQAFYMRPTPVEDWPNHGGGDFIRMPPKQQFESEHEFYSTSFHELCHWSEVRLGWTGSYATGELIAEMGAAFLCAQLNIPNSQDLTNHASYLDHWLKELREDDRAIIRAASQASKAAEMILSFSRKPEISEQKLHSA